ncbi:uncharacterized protein LOC131625940 [Vicia villosa]|uniref:uncharacterized protein LOC131625940 n=1 Tax=Vicia villosa TaxID=3911 RepID=UPI00273BAE99|nr:uncharacterized protein LOC131625940 [Vicia villosa]
MGRRTAVPALKGTVFTVVVVTGWRSEAGGGHSREARSEAVVAIWRNCIVCAFRPQFVGGGGFVSDYGDDRSDELYLQWWVVYVKTFNTPFWEARWLEGIILKEEYSSLFMASYLKRVSVAAMGGWIEGTWKWSGFGINSEFLEISRNLVLCAQFWEQLEGLSRFLEGKDSIVWNLNSEVEFSVSSCYNFYGRYFIPTGPPNKFDGFFGLLWKLDVPFKIKVFGWRLFLRIPTKDLLVYKGISFPLHDLKCNFCGIHSENRDHSFFNCLVVRKIWSEMTCWVGKLDRMEEECSSHFMDWHLFFWYKKVKDSKLGVVWLATLWTLWLVRNSVCFRNEDWNFNNFVWNIKMLVWK